MLTTIQIKHFHKCLFQIVFILGLLNGYNKNNSKDVKASK